MYDKLKKFRINRRSVLRIIDSKRFSDPSVNRKYRRLIRRAKKNKTLFKQVEIETVNRCNGLCSFCPVNARQPQRPYAKMSEELFHKIIGELADLNYSGLLSIYSNNEPLLDERIIEFYKYAREKLPNACLSMFTNGTLMTMDTFLELVKYLDQILIDNYNDEEKVIPSLKEVYGYLQAQPSFKETITFNYRKTCVAEIPRENSGDNKEFCKVSFDFRMQNEVLLSRGGQAPNKPEATASGKICLLPFIQMIIRPTGQISLCCNDALGRYTMGDVSRQRLTEIWYSEKYQRIRAEMYKNARKNLLLCKRCDSDMIPFNEKFSL